MKVRSEPARIGPLSICALAAGVFYFSQASQSVGVRFPLPTKFGYQISWALAQRKPVFDLASYLLSSIVPLSSVFAGKTPSPRLSLTHIFVDVPLPELPHAIRLDRLNCSLFSKMREMKCVYLFAGLFVAVQHLFLAQINFIVIVMVDVHAVGAITPLLRP
jgi:hypothetical protein